MIILFAPSESKKIGGDTAFDVKNLSFNSIHRKEFISLYEKHLNAHIDLQSLLSTTKDHQIHIDQYYQKRAMKAIQRYEGVAYDYLNYTSLLPKQQAFIDNYTLIFSNLYGIVKPNDFIPYYKLKQGSKLGDTTMHGYYKKQLEFLNTLDDEWLNLSANYYEKFFTPKKNHYDIKFLKEGKVVSHWAKAYRGKLLRECAIYEIDSIEKLLNHQCEAIKLIDVQTGTKKSTLLYEVQ